MKQLSIYTILPLLILLMANVANGQQTWYQWGADLEGSGTGQNFGESVALSTDGKTMVVGIPYVFTGSFMTGKAAVYTFDGSTWVQKGGDLAGDGDSHYFGSGVSINGDGNIVAVASDNGSGSDYVKVYEYTGGSWAQLGSTLLSSYASDNFGHAIALSADGTRLVVGAWDGNGAGGVVSGGYARVYQYTGGTWQLEATYEGAEAYDNMGKSVSISDDGLTIAIGVSGTNNLALPVYDSGEVQIYKWDGTAWSQVGTAIKGDTNNEDSGSSVSLSANGETVAIGSPSYDATTSWQNTGRVRVYDLTAGSWIERGSGVLNTTPDALLGASLQLSDDGQSFVVSAPSYNQTANQQGVANVFEWVGYWTHKATGFLGSAAYDNLGHCTAISGNGKVIALGAPMNDAYANNAGHVQVHSLSCRPIQPDIWAADTSFVCSGSTNVLIENSETALSYALRDNATDSVLYGPVQGNGDTLLLPTGTLTETTTFNVYAGPNEAALDFDGTNDYVEVSSLTDLSGSALTIEYWFKGSDVQSAVRYQGTASTYIVSGWSDKHIMSNNGGTTGGISMGTGVTDGNWHHVAMTWESGIANGFKSYLDGIAIDSANATSTLIADQNYPLLLGSYLGAAEYMNGTLDEVRIWNVARSAGELQASMNTELDGTETGLVAYYQFNDVPGGTAMDLSPNNHTATLMQMDTVTSWTTGYPVSGECSEAFTTTVTVTRDTLPDAGAYVSEPVLCSVNSGTSIAVPNSDPAVQYYLHNATTHAVLDSAQGNDSTLYFATVAPMTVSSNYYLSARPISGACVNIVSGTLPVTVLAPITGPADTVRTCATSYTSASGTTYSSSGTYSDTLTATNGCDSVRQLVVQLVPIAASVSSANPVCSTPGSIAVSASGGRSGTYAYAWTQTGGTAASDTNLAAGTYDIQITDLVYGSDPTCVANYQVTLADSCPLPDSLVAIQVQDNSVKLRWMVDCPPQGFRIYYKPVGAGPWTKVLQSNGNNSFKKLTGLTPSTKYMWRVESICGGNASSPLTTASFFTTLSSPCTVPDGLGTMPVYATKARVTWNAQSHVYQYKLRWRAVGGSWHYVLKDPNWTKHWITGLTPGTAYEWQIKTICLGDKSQNGTAWSAVQNFVTPASSSKQAATADAIAEADASMVLLYPNPTTGRFTIDLSGTTHDVRVNVVDVTGKVVLSQSQADVQTLQLNLEVAPGLYMVVVTANESSSVHRLVIQ